ncbi:hypothetical protein MASR2M78_19530 [Treponema sp.]
MKIDFKHLLRQYSIVLAFFVICAALSILSPAFLRVTNLLNVIRQTSIYGIMAVGMTFVILTGGIDLSVGSMLALSGIVLAGSLKSRDAHSSCCLAYPARRYTIGPNKRFGDHNGKNYSLCSNLGHDERGAWPNAYL